MKEKYFKKVSKHYGNGFDNAFIVKIWLLVFGFLFGLALMVTFLSNLNLVKDIHVIGILILVLVEDMIMYLPITKTYYQEVNINNEL